MVGEKLVKARESQAAEQKFCMEGLGIAASFGCFVGLAGQIAQGVKFLHTFFGAIKDAPADITALVAELTALRLLLGKFSHPQATSGFCLQQSIIPKSSPVFSIPMSQQLLTEEVQPALDHCELWVNKLQELVLLYEPSAKLSKGKRVWAQINIALRNKKFKKYLEGLERAKSMLQQAQIVIMMNRIATINHISTQILSQSTALTLNQSFFTSHMAKTESALTVLEQNVDDLKSAVHSSLAQANSDESFSQWRPLVEECISNQIQKELGFISLQPLECDCPKIKLKVLNHGSAWNLDQRENYPEPRHERTEISAHETANANPRRHINILTSHKTCLGTILISAEKRKMNPHLSQLVTKIDLLPASWLLRTGFTITITRAVSAYTKPSPTYSLRPIEIITNTNRVLGAMLGGDIVTVQKCFASKVVSPFATFSNGLNLVHVLTFMMFNVSVGTFSYCTELDDWSDITGVPLTKWGHQDPRKVWAQWENYKSMFTWLCSLGVDIGAKFNTGRTPMQFLFRILRLDADSFDEEEDVLHLALSALETAKSNLLRAHHSGEIGEILRKCLRGGEWSPLSCLDGQVLENEEWAICTDDGQCVATAAIWDEIYPSPAARSPDWETWIPMKHECRWSINLFSRRSEVESKFIRNIVDGIPTSKSNKSDQSFAKAIIIIFGTIKIALLHGSPLKAFDQCSIDKGLIRQSITGDVACMIPADPLLATLHFDGGTLTMWARTWRVLDLWREALFIRGFGSADVDWLTGKAWREDRHLYYDTVECEVGVPGPGWWKGDTEDNKARREDTAVDPALLCTSANVEEMIMVNAFSAHPAISLLS